MNLFMKVYYNLPITKLIRTTPTVLVTTGKREYNLPHHRLTPRWVRALASAEKNVDHLLGEFKTCLIPGPK